MWRKISIEDYRLALDTVVVVAVLVGVRELLFYIGIEGIALTSLTASVIGGGVFVMGLVIAGTLSDYKEAERTPNNLAAGLYAILREAESMHRVWKKPDLDRLRERLVAVVDALRRDIAAGDTRECQEAVENLSESFLELEESDVPANYIVRLRQEQAGLRKSLLSVYQIQREEFLPSAYAMIVSFVVMILTLLMLTKIHDRVETLVTLGFLSFFFLYLLRLLNVINKPFKVGRQRSNDDVSLFILYEFVVHARAADAGVSSDQVVGIAERIEQIEEAASGENAAALQDGRSDDAPPDLDAVVDAAAEAHRDDPKVTGGSRA